MRRPVVVIDFGSPSAQVVARRVREAHVYSQVVPHYWPAQKILDLHPAAIILADGPGADPAAPQEALLVQELLGTGVPLLGVGSGFRRLLAAAGADIEAGEPSPPESTDPEPQSAGPQEITRTWADSLLLDGTPDEQTVTLSEGWVAGALPAGFAGVAAAQGVPFAAAENRDANLYGVQWNPQVAPGEASRQLFRNFLHGAAGLEPTWTPAAVVADLVEKIREQVGSAQVICGLSGGVDSSVAAALVHEAVGDQLTCIFVDHGLLRAGERDQVETDYANSMGIRVITADEEDAFLTALQGVRDPEKKRKIIGHEFIRSFEDAARALADEAESRGDSIDFLVQGTIYPDVIESGAEEGQSHVKSHHNVGGLPDDLTFDLVEPLRDLFKEEVRAIGRELGVPEKIVARQPFPGPGLGIRVIGEVTKDNLDTLRAADLVVREELTQAGMDDAVWQCPVVLLADVRSVGVQDEERTYGHPVVLRPVMSEDAMTADWVYLPHELLARISNRVIEAVPGVNRVVLDVTGKPPGTIEWE